MESKKTELELNEMILDITNNIRDQYPDLMKYVNEKPLTIPYQEHPTNAVSTLSSYYEQLQGLIDEYKANGFVNLKEENMIDIPITEIKVMEHKTAFQSLLTEVNDITISYNDVGEGTIPIIFLHGFPFDKSMWNGQLECLKATNRVIALDLRGFGKTINQNSILSIDLLAQDVVAFMDKLKIEKAIICGLSMGGYIALNLMKNFPNRFEALILCDTQCGADGVEGKQKRYDTIEKINNDGPLEFNANFIKGVFHPDSFTHKAEVVENLRGIVGANSVAMINAGLAALAEREETCTILPSIRIPTLIICGKQDELTPVSKSEFMNQHIPNSSLKVIDHAGHVSNLEQEEEFNKHLSHFVTSLK